MIMQITQIGDLGVIFSALQFVRLKMAGYFVTVCAQVNRTKSITKEDCFSKN